MAALEGTLKEEQKELADFIRVGSTRGHQCFGSYFDDKGGSCALGAVYEGVYHLPRDARQADTRSSRDGCSAASTR